MHTGTMGANPPTQSFFFKTVEFISDFSTNKLEQLAKLATPSFQRCYTATAHGLGCLKNAIFQLTIPGLVSVVSFVAKVIFSSCLTYLYPGVFMIGFTVGWICRDQFEKEVEKIDSVWNAFFDHNRNPMGYVGCAGAAVSALFFALWLNPYSILTFTCYQGAHLAYKICKCADQINSTYENAQKHQSL